MRAALIVLVAALGLSACGTPDKFGNEKPDPFGIPATAPTIPVKVYPVATRAEEARFCKSTRGYLSHDGNNCVVQNVLVDPSWCVEANVVGAPVDSPWENAICNGWRP